MCISLRVGEVVASDDGLVYFLRNTLTELETEAQAELSRCIAHFRCNAEESLIGDGGIGRRQQYKRKEAAPARDMTCL